MNARLQSLPQKKPHTLPLNLYDPLPFPHYLAFPQYTFPPDFFDTQATTIQKVFKGYKTRKLFVNTKLNPITKHKKPDQYHTEKFLFEIAKEFIEDALVGLCLESYYPISNTREMKAMIMLEHLTNRMIHDTCRSIIKRSEAAIMYDDLLVGLIREAFQDTVRDEIRAYLMDTRTELAMDSVYDEVFLESIFAVLLEIAVEREYLQVVDEEIFETAVEYFEVTDFNQGRRHTIPAKISKTKISPN
ncbi:hypothetical protein HDV01_000077 [Terramyces sp. JEL0728]|nr:hypothetical protein HDV01_000077 [Terramyces sp. JEL0728]